MQLIQPVLIVALLAVGALYVTLVRSRLLYRLATIVLLTAGILFVLNPDLTNRIAHGMGVGRGADLLLYVLCVVTLSAFLHIYRRYRTLEEKLTEVARQIAISSARRPAQDQR